MNKVSKTDWKRLAEMSDEDIDTSDIPELGDDFFNHAQLRMPAKKSVTLRLDEDVLEFLKSEGQGYQTRINKLLRNYMDVQLHRVHHK
ncbi:BrnA antitoxin family protein [Catenovulum sediminis]|uniref:BrnA antitoxin family protein n=1 Tax=Catenovulum sediminis TaxID=1740262 RepID=A0ABV1RN78_9ALTE